MQTTHMATPVLEVAHLEKVYGALGNVTRALNDVSFTVNRGDFVGIMGASGSCKATLLNCVSTIDSATSGTIRINGQDVTRMKQAKLSQFRREELGFIFQDSNLLDTLTARENIALPLTIARTNSAEISTRVQDVAARLSISQVLDKNPYQMSGGQQQRVAIARALITKPKLVFADEPTGNLDSVSSAEVLGFLKRSVNELGQTIVMVTHDAVAASYADRAIVFADGQIVADEANPTAETMNDLLMAERERATRAAVTSTRADTLARLAGVKDVPNLPITDAPLPPAGRTGTMHHARAAAQHAR